MTGIAVLVGLSCKIGSERGSDRENVSTDNFAYALKKKPTWDFSANLRNPGLCPAGFSPQPASWCHALPDRMP